MHGKSTGKTAVCKPAISEFDSRLVLQFEKTANGNQYGACGKNPPSRATIMSTNLWSPNSKECKAKIAPYRGWVPTPLMVSMTITVFQILGSYAATAIVNCRHTNPKIVLRRVLRSAPRTVLKTVVRESVIVRCDYPPPFFWGYGTAATAGNCKFPIFGYPWFESKYPHQFL